MNILLIFFQHLCKFPEQGNQKSANQQQKSTRDKLLPFDSFPGRKALVERTPLIRHSGPRQTQEEIQRQQNAERSSSNSENQAFLRDLCAQVLCGEGRYCFAEKCIFFVFSPCT